MINGIVTVMCFASFLGIAFWAWARSNRARFEEASRLPLSDEAEAPCCCADPQTGARP